MALLALTGERKAAALRIDLLALAHYSYGKTGAGGSLSRAVSDAMAIEAAHKGEEGHIYPSGYPKMMVMRERGILVERSAPYARLQRRGATTA